jgi:hypothetical protein
MLDPLAALLQGALQGNQFPPTSRYAGIGLSTYQKPDGTEVVHLKRRFLPQPSELSVVYHHVVTSVDRLDVIAAQYLGDPLQFWQICDANDVLDPDELLAVPGGTLQIALSRGLRG